MRLEELLSKVPDNWRKDFLKFIDSGEASAAFEQVLNSDPSVQDAVEIAFTAKSEGLEDLARRLAESRELPDQQDIFQVISGGIAESLDAATRLAPKDSERVMALAAQHVAKVEPETANRMQSLLTGLQERLREQSQTVNTGEQTCGAGK